MTSGTIHHKRIVRIRNEIYIRVIDHTETWRALDLRRIFLHRVATRSVVEGIVHNRRPILPLDELGSHKIGRLHCQLPE